MRRLPAEHRWLFIACLCIARTSPEPGRLFISEGIPATIEDIADEAGQTVEVVAAGVEALQFLNMMHLGADGVWVVSNFLERQYDNPSDAPDAARARQQKSRDKKKDSDGHERVTSLSRPCHDTDTDTDTDTEADTEADTELNNSSDFISDEEIYFCYPRKIHRGKAIPAIRNAIKRITSGQDRPEWVAEAWPPENPRAWLIDRVQRYAASPKGNKGTYTPYPASWFNAKGYSDHESTWEDTRELNGNSHHGKSKSERDLEGALIYG